MNEEIVKYKKSSRLNSKKDDRSDISINKDWKIQNIDIIIYYQQRINDPPKIIKSFKIYLNDKFNIVTSCLIDTLKKDSFIRQESSFSFYDHTKKMFVYGFSTQVGNILPEINAKYIFKNTIKIRSKKKMIVQALIDQQKIKYEDGEEQKTSKQKQKKIGEVVEKVALWRKFYTGFYDENNNYIQKPLENAAQEVGIAKKTLDDYLLQIRNGKKYGFNFNEKFNSKIGELRAFVRDQRKKQAFK